MIIVAISNQILVTNINSAAMATTEEIHFCEASGPWACLSNYYDAEFEIDGKKYKYEMTTKHRRRNPQRSKNENPLIITEGRIQFKGEVHHTSPMIFQKQRNLIFFGNGLKEYSFRIHVKVCVSVTAKPIISGVALFGSVGWLCLVPMTYFLFSSILYQCCNMLDILKNSSLYRAIKELF